MSQARSGTRHQRHIDDAVGVGRHDSIEGGGGAPDQTSWLMKVASLPVRRRPIRRGADRDLGRRPARRAALPPATSLANGAATIRVEARAPGLRTVENEADDRGASGGTGDWFRNGPAIWCTTTCSTDSSVNLAHGRINMRELNIRHSTCPVVSNRPDRRTPHGSSYRSRGLQAVPGRAGSPYAPPAAFTGTRALYGHLYRPC